MIEPGSTRIDASANFGGGCPPLGPGFVDRCAEDLTFATRLCPQALLAATTTQLGRNAVRAHFAATPAEQALRLCELLAATGSYPPEIIAALFSTPRPDLVPPATRPLGWWNGANCGPRSLTVFSPWLACYCLAALGVDKGDSVLILGYGGGFTTILAANVVGKRGRVCALEVDPDTAHAGQSCVHSLDLVQAEVRLGSALDTLPRGPFDHILATLSSSMLPDHWFAAVGAGGTVGTFRDIISNDNQPACLFEVYTSPSEPAVRAMAGLINSPFEHAPRVDTASDYPDLVDEQNRMLATLSKLYRAG